MNTQNKVLKTEYGFATVKVYGIGDNKRIKLTVSRRNRGTENYKAGNTDCSVNEEKLDCNIQRAKSCIYELAFCNEWDFFFTGTLNPQKWDRTNFPKFYSKFAKYIANIKRRGFDVKYLIIPELHSDGKSWHIHGFLKGLPECELHKFEIGDKMSSYIAKKVRMGCDVYNWVGYADRFGFCDLEPIRSVEAVSKYTTKYITKELFGLKKYLGRHIYYHSRGLNLAEKVKVGVFDGIEEFDFSNDYCSVKWCDYNKKNLRSMCSKVYKPTTAEMMEEETTQYYRAKHRKETRQKHIIQEIMKSVRYNDFVVADNKEINVETGEVFENVGALQGDTLPLDLIFENIGTVH